MLTLAAQNIHIYLRKLFRTFHSDPAGLQGDFFPPFTKLSFLYKHLVIQRQIKVQGGRILIGPLGSNNFLESVLIAGHTRKKSDMSLRSSLPY